jgi:NAD(P)-dependent dehydrogenase (short-subunit alcohol dehydrogenase family)
MSELILKGKTALVTGGGRGIGKEITRRLAAAGANVAIASRKQEKLNEAAREMADLPGDVLPVTCHVGRPYELEKLVRETEAALGPVDVLVNNAATNPAHGPALGVTDEAFLKTVEINCVFYDPYVQVVLRERVPIVGKKMGGLAPGETKAFRLAFDNVPEGWNQAMPQMVIAGIDFS